MNILFFHKNGIYPNAGGISRITHILGQLLRDSGHTIIYLSIRPIRCKNYEYDKFQFFLPDDNLFTKKNTEFVVNFLVSHKIDVVINQSAIDTRTLDFWGLVKKQSSVKIISCMHNSLLTPIINYAYQKEWVWKNNRLKWLFYLAKTECAKGLLKKYYILKNRKRFRRVNTISDKVVFLCDGLAEEFNAIIGFNSDKIAVIPNCNEKVSIFSQKKNEVLWIGTVNFSVKRIDFMLNVWKRIHDKVPDWNLIILGDGPGLVDAKRYAKELQLERYSFRGRVRPEEYYRTAKISCVTSSHEAFSLVILESMCNGVIPVVNNSFPAASMLIEDGKDGLLIKPFSVDDFAASLLSLMKSDENIRRMSEMAIEKSKEYSLENILTHWNNLLISLSNDEIK